MDSTPATEDLPDDIHFQQTQIPKSDYEMYQHGSFDNDYKVEALHIPVHVRTSFSPPCRLPWLEVRMTSRPISSEWPKLMYPSALGNITPCFAQEDLKSHRSI
ncbi:uncharacterized protein LOC113214609 [Frankliniella occidentalis]|uniref:Uncharacterized protein LOC113214609 n=1 Tax=Frankliniella occidentalis TaxID=133901 RepID=A0A9C6X4X4_FRAOC|nr:uncharacterized protein LOC113214609 [Frankliniella occidentalis]